VLRSARTNGFAQTISIPLIPVIAFIWDRLGVEQDAAMTILRDAVEEAMLSKSNEYPEHQEPDGRGGRSGGGGEARSDCRTPEDAAKWSDGCQ